MIRDARSIADLYLENAATATANSLLQTKATPPSNLPASTATPAVAGGVIASADQSNEEPKEKPLPAKHWVKVEKIVKNDVKDIENLAHEVAMLVHSCSENEEVISKVMSKIFKKHRAWSKKK
jgi:hypothetical protein